MNEDRCTSDEPAYPRLNIKPCGFCGRSDPHEHSIDEFEEAERHARRFAIDRFLA